MKNSIIKLITGILCIGLCGTILCGCSTKTYTTDNTNQTETEQEETEILDDSQAQYFEVIGFDSENAFYLVREKRTDVMYTLYLRRSPSSRSYCGLTVMLDADGTPLLYSEWVEMEEK